LGWYERAVAKPETAVRKPLVWVLVTVLGEEVQGARVQLG
jgi:hypothetical protein